MKMNKKLVAMAVAAALAAPLAAQAGVTTYGQARVSVNADSNNNPNTGVDDSGLSVSSNASRLGFKGDDTLANGLTFVWQLEAGVTMDNGVLMDDDEGLNQTPGFGSGAHFRDSFVGLAGDWGTVLAGRHATPYRMATENFDPFVDTRADFNAVIGSVSLPGGSANPTINVGNTDTTPGSATTPPSPVYLQVFNNRANNVIAYVTPEVNGFMGAIAYVVNYDDLLGGPGDALGSGSAGRRSAAGDQDAYSLEGTYKNGPLFVAAAYESLNNLTKTGTNAYDDATAWKVAGSWNFGQGTEVGALWESIDLGGNN
ncbi:MAG: porin, partial [Gammaproteobacteria bacterium]